MNSLYIKQTEDTPFVHFDITSGRFEIKGNSIPENVYLFYDPVLLWLDKYTENPHEKTEFVFQMKMISSASTKVFFDILNKIEGIAEDTTSEVKVAWLYSIYDDEIREIGLDYRDWMKVPFDLVLIDKE